MLLEQLENRLQLTAIPVDGGWQPFDWNNAPGVSVGTFDFSCDDPTLLKVTDVFVDGDQFTITDFGTEIGTTSSPTDDGTQIGNNPDVGFSDSRYSSGTFSLSAGSHSLTIEIIASATGHPEGYAHLRVDTDDSMPRIKIEAVDDTAAETQDSSNPGQFKLTRINATGSPPTQVTLQVTGTATAGDDYPAIQQVVSVGDSPLYINLAPSNDALKESTETVILTIDPSVDYKVEPAHSSATVNILDNDQWSVRIAATQYATENGMRDGLFTISRFGETDLTHPLSVTFGMLAGTATEDVDYISLAHDHPTFELTIPAGATDASLIVEAKNDFQDEGDESVIVGLSPPSSGRYSVDPYNDEATVWINETKYKLGLLPDLSLTQDMDLMLAGPCGCAKPEAVGQAKGDSAISVADGLAGSLDSSSMGGLRYDSDDNPHPIIALDIPLSQQVSQAVRLETQLTIEGLSSSTVVYDAQTLTAEGLYRFASRLDASSLPTGRYQWTLVLTEVYMTDGAEHPITRTYNGVVNINNLIDSIFGNRWSLRGFDHLVSTTDGKLLVKGNGNLLFFAGDDVNGYSRDSFDTQQSALSLDINGTYTVKTKTGVKSVFDADGRIVGRSDIHGNNTTYHYLSNGRLDYVEDYAGRRVALEYGTNGKVSRFTDPAGRVTELNFASGRLVSVTEQGTGSGNSTQTRVTTFTYDPSSQLLATVTRGSDAATTLSYNANRTIHSISHGTTTEIHDVTLSRGLMIPGTGVGTPASPASLTRTSEVTGTYTDARNNTKQYTTNFNGQIEWLKDATNGITSIEYNSRGQVTRRTDPDPDGSGQLPAPSTSYTYDDFGNLLSVTYPDGSTEVWTYDSVFNQMVSYVNQVGKLTLYTLDTLTGERTSTRQVVGQVDGINNNEHDDLVTTFSYTPTPADPSDPPAGLVAITVNPLGVVTHNYYDSHGNVAQIRYAEGTIDQADVYYEHDTDDHETAYVDENGRRTEL